nr:serine/threonine-protein kinase haspin homolog isoform X2 [Coffea arabica]
MTAINVTLLLLHLNSYQVPMMVSKSSGDLWEEILAEEDGNLDRGSDFGNSLKPKEPEITVLYRRRKCQNPSKDVVAERRRSNSSSTSLNENRVSLVPAKRVSWNRSLSTRGRTSITVEAFVGYQPQQRKSKRKGKPPLPKTPSFDKEIAYFKEVDSFELLEESPSPKRSGTWLMGVQTDKVAIPHLSSVLRKWLIAQKQGCGPPLSLTKILQTPAVCKESVSSALRTLEDGSLPIHPSLSIQNRINFSSLSGDFSIRPSAAERCSEKSCEDIQVAVGKLSLTSYHDSQDGLGWDPLLALLTACGQSAPSTLLDVLLSYCDSENISKVGEGTFGEAFKVGETVCKIVPFGGDFQVNGEVQKRPEELLEEVMLSCTLNRLRRHGDDVLNACTSFIQTIDLRVCKGHYGAALIKAWEDWDGKHGSENDHPKEFPENQNYVVFVQEHGGKDLESFVLLNTDEARSLLLQVTLALAVAEAAYEFEHRDLHWGNILLSRKGSETLSFTLEGRKVNVRTYGLLISIIDFTLSRINTGEDILFLDLSLDPEIFEGPKGDKQFDTYRKMKEVTDECWQGSFPKTNVLWLQYLVDILLLKKSYDRTSKDQRDLRSLKKRLNGYGSARDAAADPFFSDLFVNHES